MIPFQMIVLNEFRQGPSEVALAEWNQTIEAFGFDGPHEALRVGVRVQGLIRGLHHMRRCYEGIASLAVTVWPRNGSSVGFITSTVSSKLRREANRRGSSRIIAEYSGYGIAH